MRNKATLVNIDNSDLIKYPNGRIKNQTGLGDGTPINEVVYGDIHEAKDKLMRLYGILHNGLPDNEVNGYQLVDAMIALASKNDFTLPLNTVGGVLTVPLKISFLKDNETFLLKATVDKTTETQIKGTLDNTTKPIDFVGDFKAGEYVRMINTAANIILIREVDFVNLNTAVTELNFLKAATGAEVIAGVINTKAVTPETFLEAFAEYVIGAESDNFLATVLRNGLYPKTHFDIVENIGSSPIKNVGWISGLDVRGSVGSLPVSGNITSATVTNVSSDASLILVTMANAMADTNYLVKMYVQSMSSNTLYDDNIFVPIFKPVSVNQFQIGIAENVSEAQNLKIHIEVQQL